MSANPRIGAIVLAAGFSSRFGGTKLRARLNSGYTVLQQTVATVQSIIPQVLLVTRPDSGVTITDSSVYIEAFSDAEKGMGASLAFGMRQALQHFDWDGCLVCLGDMPFIRPETYLALAEALGADNIVLPDYGGTTGNPVGFGRVFFTALTGLHGDQGGRDVIRDNSDAVVRITVNDPAISQDIDTPDDLIRYDQT
ncbi:MAG: nucleotidyltransferase family protein [Gammaproteobacteria bacterium]